MGKGVYVYFMWVLGFDSMGLNVLKKMPSEAWETEHI